MDSGFYDVGTVLIVVHRVKKKIGVCKEKDASNNLVVVGNMQRRNMMKKRK
jgi:hypothetical protein